MTSTSTTNLIARIRENDLGIEGVERDSSDQRGGVVTYAHAWEERMRFQSLEQTITFDGANLLEDNIAATFQPTHANPHSFPTGRVGSAGAIGTNGGLIPQQPVTRVERSLAPRAGSARWGSGVPTVPGVPLSSAAAIAMISARHQLEQGQDSAEGNGGDGGNEEDGDGDGDADGDGDDRDMSAGTNDAIAIEHRFRALRITRALQGDTDEREEEGGSIGNHSNEEYRYDLIDHTGGSVSPFTLFDDLQMLGDGVMDSLDASLLASPDSSTMNGLYGDDKRERTNDLTPQFVQRDGRMNRGALNNTGSTDDLHNRMEQDGDSGSDDSASAAGSKSFLGLGSFDGMLDGSDFSNEGRDSDDRDDLEGEGGEGVGSVFGENTDGDESFCRNVNDKNENESEGEESEDGDGDGDGDMELQRAILRSIGESDYNDSNVPPLYSPSLLPQLKAMITDLSFQCCERLEILDNMNKEKKKSHCIGKNNSNFQFLHRLEKLKSLNYFSQGNYSFFSLCSYCLIFLIFHNTEKINQLSLP